MYFDAYAVGNRIQKLRRNKKLTQEQLAIKLNISDRHLGKIERGERTGSIDLLIEVAVHFEVSLDYLILGKKPQFSEAQKRLQVVIRELAKIEEIL